MGGCCAHRTRMDRRTPERRDTVVEQAKVRHSSNPLKIAACHAVNHICDPRHVFNILCDSYGEMHPSVVRGEPSVTLTSGNSLSTRAWVS
jgi:hypothetical protein